MESAVTVALGILILGTIIAVVSILRYPKVDDAVKVLGVFSGLFGVISGGLASYFFTREPLQKERERGDNVSAELTTARQDAADAREALAKYVGADRVQESILASTTGSGSWDSSKWTLGSVPLWMGRQGSTIFPQFEPDTPSTNAQDQDAPGDGDVPNPQP